MMGVIYMNELQVFNNPEFGEVRSIQIDGEPWFVGKDVAAALGYENTRDALVKHVDEEDKGVTIRDSIGREQNLTVINICRHAKMAHLRCSVIFQKLG